MSDEKMSAAETEDVNLPGGTVAAIVTATKPRDAPAAVSGFIEMCSRRAARPPAANAVVRRIGP